MDQTGQVRLLRKQLGDISRTTYNFSTQQALEILQEYRSQLFTLREPRTIALLCLYIPIFFLALGGNSLVIFVVIKNQHLRRVKNLFLVNLACADLCVTLICIPIAVGRSLYKLWVYGQTMCKFTSFLQGVAVVASIYTLTSLSIDRYLAIKTPKCCGRLTKKCQALKMLVVIWILSAMLAGPILFVKVIHKETFLYFGTLEFCVEQWPKALDQKAYSVFYLVAVYAIPTLIVATCYGLIGRTLCSDEFHRKTSDSSSTVMLGRKRVARMLIALIVVFIVCWLPYNISSLGFDLQMDSLDQQILPFTLWLGHAHSAVNPLLYWFLNKSFRCAMRRALTCGCRINHFKKRSLNAHTRKRQQERQGREARWKQEDVGEKLQPSPAPEESRSWRPRKSTRFRVQSPEDLYGGYETRSAGSHVPTPYKFLVDSSTNTESSYLTPSLSDRQISTQTTPSRRTPRVEVAHVAIQVHMADLITTPLTRGAVGGSPMGSTGSLSVVTLADSADIQMPTPSPVIARHAFSTKVVWV